jgi:hypothetical protein
VSAPRILKSSRANTIRMNSWLIHSSIFIIVSITVAVTINQPNGQEVTQSTYASDSIQAQNDNASLIASVINITNHTNPVGSSVQQMIQATSTSNTTTEINWGEICRNPLIDPFIAEPCETLTTPDGFTLTPEGQRVLNCIGTSTFATLLKRPELASLGSAIGCNP